MTDSGTGCARPTGARVGDSAPAENQSTSPQKEEAKPMVMARVGYPAPDFEAPAYYRGAFGKVKLSDFKGKWVLVCFYPGDFTFV